MSPWITLEAAVHYCIGREEDFDIYFNSHGYTALHVGTVLSYMPPDSVLVARVRLKMEVTYVV